MYAVVARYKNGGFHLLGFASSEEEVNRLIDRHISAYGAEALGEAGVHFDIELAA